MQQVVRENTPMSVLPESPRKQTLAPRMVEDAVARLFWVCLTCDVLLILSVLLNRLLQPDLVALMRTPAMALTWLAVLLLSLGIGSAYRWRLLPPVIILNLGLAFEVLVAFAISFSETAVPMNTGRPVHGISEVVVWIGMVGLLIPNRPRIKILVALASASMWPLAYALNLRLYGYEPLPLNRLLVWMYAPYLMALMTYAISKRIFIMEKAVQKVRELGSYSLDSLIGKGGMGEVWRARHHMLARDAAIKLIRADVMAGQSGYQYEVTRKRFEREAQAIASLKCPHTVELFDFGVSQDGSFFYVMELLDGISLEVMVEKFGPQPASRVIHILRQVCESLEEAHRRGLVHRDIKPTNIFACAVGIESDFAKVLDFGLVKHISQKDTVHLTAEGTAAGTPAYLAPEIAMGEEQIDGRADLYGLGCVAYFLLTGVPVFDEKTATATALAHVQKNPVPPSQRTEVHVPSRLEETVLRCLAKKPSERPPSAMELSRLLEESGVPEWTRENAAQWWQTYLPDSSSYRVARQPCPEPPVSSQRTWSYIAE